MNRSNFFEKSGPILVAIITFICTVIISTRGFMVGIDQYLNDLLNAVITLSSILIGFIGVLLGLLFSLRNSKIVELLFQYTTKEILKSYFKRAILSGTIIVGISILLYVRELINFNILTCITVVDILGSLWCANLVHLMLATYILIDIIMHIVFDAEVVESSNGVQEQKDYSKLEQKYADKKNDSIAK
nr:hypothetical protein [uncultured Niameybacter sp.]